jgi:hypothetical protein
LSPEERAPADRPRLDFLLLSNRLSADAVRRFLAMSSPYPVVLIGSAVTLPDDVAERMARVQWLEFREQLPYQISGFVMTLRRWAPAQLLYASNVRPHGFAALAAPIGARQGAAGTRSLAAYWLAGGLLALAGLASPVHAVGFGLAAWQFALTHAVYRRSLPLWTFAGLYVSNIAVAWWVGVPQLLAESLTVDLPYLRFWTPTITLWLIAAQAGLGLLQFAQAWRWFPHGLPRHDAIGGPPHAALLRGHIVYVVGAVFAAIYMAINLQ